jgi:CDP-6-deoxy-D-xylo-4-hexulose-3-dehydrase
VNIDFAKADFGKEEVEAVNRVLNGNWLASGPENEAFEKEFAEYVGTKCAVGVNSGSSANLLALTSLEIQKGSTVLTAACGFPAILAPILHLGLRPALVDYDLETHNIDLGQVAVESGVSAIIVAHTLANPIDMKRLMQLADSWKIPVIEDCCEAVGSKVHGKKVGSFGKLATFSFYPAHQMTAEGTGGMIVTDDAELARRCRSLRDWGKVWDWDTKLGDNKTKFEIKIDNIPYYKHYTYESVGFNMKLSETAAAFGRVQIKRLDHIRERRIENYNKLYKKLEPLEAFHLVKAMEGAEPSWFGFPVTLKQGAAKDRMALTQHLDRQGIGTRLLFGSNLTRQPYFEGRNYRISGDLRNTDRIIDATFWLGVFPGLSAEMLDYVVLVLKEYFRR